MSTAKEPSPEFTSLFSDIFPDHAENLNACIHRYMQRWFEEWFLGQPNPTRKLDADTWLRDVTLVAMVFMVEQEFHIARKRACEIVTESFEQETGDRENIVPVKPFEIEAMTMDHASLLSELEGVIAPSS